MKSILEAKPPNDLLWVRYHDLSVFIEQRHKFFTYSDKFTCLDSVYFSGRVGEGAKGWGHAARNRWLETNTLGWTYFLDDDNLMHPNFFEGFEMGSSKNVIILGQETAQGLREPGRSVCNVDLGQLVFRRECVGDLRFNLHYEADGEFIERLTSVVPCNFVSGKFTYYNRLRW